jgi:hypothetical protein
MFAAAYVSIRDVHPNPETLIFRVGKGGFVNLTKKTGWLMY